MAACNLFSKLLHLTGKFSKHSLTEYPLGPAVLKTVVIGNQIAFIGTD
jgi:hypothetical protein